MNLRFTKMHGLGNDFMVIDGVRQSVALSASTIRQWADRHFGIGFDQLLLIEPAESTEADFRYRIFNADGGEVAQCGNGARCFARFVQDQGLSTRNPLRVRTAQDVLELFIQDDGQISVSQGVPRWSPTEIPLQVAEQALRYTLDVAGREVTFGAVSLGNPHAVVLVDALEQAEVASVGALLATHPQFPQGVNVGFMQVIQSDVIRLRVFERGVGETLACGSGACAAVAVGQRWGLLKSQVQVRLPGGELSIEWQAANQKAPLILTGPAIRVFEGVIETC